MPKRMTTQQAEEKRAQLIRQAYPDGAPDVDEAELMAAMDLVMQDAGLPPELRYAAQKTGRIVSVENEHLLSEEELLEWDEAVAEYLRLHPRPARRLPRWRR